MTAFAVTQRDFAVVLADAYPNLEGKYQGTVDPAGMLHFALSH